MTEVISLGTAFVWYEQALLEARKRDDVGDTIFLQLTYFEFMLCAYGLFVLRQLYGNALTRPLLKKMAEIANAQGFEIGEE